MSESVKAIFDALLEKGYSQKDAAKEAQARTGYSIVSRKPIKGPKIKTNKEWKFGEYD